MTNIRDVSNLDFNAIKSNLKEYLKSQDKFNDYDFDGSGMSILLDILAYNTHMNTVLAHTAVNETFLNSAKKRQNISSHAQNLGYVPRSTQSSRVIGTVTMVPSNLENPPVSLTMVKGTTFNTTINGTPFTFITNTDYATGPELVEGAYRYVFSDIDLIEGTAKTIRYRANNISDYQRFEIPSTSVDLSTVVVKVYESPNTAVYETYIPHRNIIELDDESAVFFAEESVLNRYEIFFGDNVIGKRPADNSVVEIEYIVSSGDEGNGASSFVIGSLPAGVDLVTFAPSSGFTRSIGGALAESDNSVRFNAPLSFAAQNRAVTTSDFSSLVYGEFGYVQDISVWGGEYASPPVYGKVYLCIKPKDREFLTEAEKSDISRYLLSKCVASITPEIINPDYTYIAVEALYKYNPALTNLSISGLNAVVYNTINSYNNSRLAMFDGVLRSSNLASAIDNSERAILNTVLRIEMYKTFTPSEATDASYTITFSAPIYESYDEVVVSSTSFTVGGREVYIQSVPSLTQIGSANLALYYTTGGDMVPLANNVGSVDFENGIVSISGINISSTSPITITTTPASNDIAPRNNHLIKIDDITVTGEIDTIIASNGSSSTNYTTFKRHK